MPSALAHAHGGRFIVAKRVDGAGERCDVGLRHEQAGLSVDYVFRKAADVRRYHGFAEAVRQMQHTTLSSGSVRQGDNPCEFKILGNVFEGNIVEIQYHTLFEAEIADPIGKFAEFGKFMRPASNKQSRTIPALATREGFDQLVETLVWPYAAEKQHNGFMFFKP